MASWFDSDLVAHTRLALKQRVLRVKSTGETKESVFDTLSCLLAVEYGNGFVETATNERP